MTLNGDRPVVLAMVGIAFVVGVLALVVCAECRLAKRETAVEARAKARADRQEVILKMLESLSKSIERVEARIADKP